MQHAFQRLLGALKFLVLKELQSFLVSLKLRLLGWSVRIRGRRFELGSGLSKLSFQWFMALSRSIFGAGPGTFHLANLTGNVVDHSKVAEARQCGEYGLR